MLPLFWLNSLNKIQQKLKKLYRSTDFLRELNKLYVRKFELKWSIVATWTNFFVIVLFCKLLLDQILRIGTIALP